MKFIAAFEVGKSIPINDLGFGKGIRSLYTTLVG